MQPLGVIDADAKDHHGVDVAQHRGEHLWMHLGRELVCERKLQAIFAAFGEHLGPGDRPEEGAIGLLFGKLMLTLPYTAASSPGRRCCDMFGRNRTRLSCEQAALYDVDRD